MDNGFSDPKRNLDQFGLMEGMTVADFGVGSGFYSLYAAKRVGEAGKVYAIDVQKDLLSRLKNQARTEGLDNIEIIWGDLEKENGSKLATESVEAVFVTDILFQVEDIPAFLKEASRVLKKKGRMLVVDWSDSYSNLGPPQNKIITKEKASVIFNNFGLVHDRDIEAGEHHWGMVLKKT